MGWQGRMRGTKAERLWRMMPTEVTQGARLMYVRCWRDDDQAWVTFRRGEDWYTLRVLRATGALSPLSGIGEGKHRHTPLSDRKEQIAKRWTLAGPGAVGLTPRERFRALVKRVEDECPACRHTLVQHEESGWTCDCAACPWKEKPAGRVLNRSWRPDGRANVGQWPKHVLNSHGIPRRSQ